MVQTRWGHINRDASMLTRVQALMLDGHHLVENRARFGAGLLFNFSGTGGIWRREAILSAGSWEHDTLTEDLDLSYRAQLAGWKFIYREDVVSPSELPEDLSAVRAQQYRWAKGTVQTARKLMKRVLSSDLTLHQRVEAFFHMTPHFAYPLLVLLSVMLLPALVLMPATSAANMLLVDLPLCTATTGSLAAFYMLAESAQGRPRAGALARLPMVIALGTGLAPHLTRAVLEGWRQMAGEFVRTPKQGDNKGRYRAAAELPLFETALSALSFVSVVASIQTGHYFATPFALLFTIGYAYVAVLLVREQATRRRENRAPDGGEGASVQRTPCARRGGGVSPVRPAPCGGCAGHAERAPAVLRGAVGRHRRRAAPVAHHVQPRGLTGQRRYRPAPHCPRVTCGSPRLRGGSPSPGKADRLRLAGMTSREGSPTLDSLDLPPGPSYSSDTTG